MSASNQEIVTEILGGVWAPSCTPITEEGLIDNARLVGHIHRLLSSGCRGVVLFGTTGEGTSFSVAERTAALEAVAHSGIGADQMMVGVGFPSIADTVSLCRNALTIGYSNLLVLPPFYYKTVETVGLFRSFAAVIDGIDDESARIYLYHIPSVSQVPVSGELIERLLNSYGKTVVGLKDSSGDIGHTRSLMRLFPDLAVFSGSEASLLPLLQDGAKGCISALANVNAPAISEVYDLWSVGDSQAAADVQKSVNKFGRLLDNYPRIPAIKHLIAHTTGDRSWRRLLPPLVELDDEQARLLIDEVDGHYQ